MKFYPKKKVKQRIRHYIINMPKELITINEAAKLTCVLDHTVRTWVRNGWLSVAKRKDGRIFLDKKDVVKLAPPPCPACGKQFFRTGNRRLKRHCSTACEKTKL
ncbi:MAG: hypothetical protein A2283_02445 [Lentisphaerae bacterium RIFOXYA12_FULL_48_11]|nr:MAG: hypothetical protein A2283_02445 [Lentisphaerae bacterium RIFOXYA12_FULL_48_11]